MRVESLRMVDEMVAPAEAKSILQGDTLVTDEKRSLKLTRRISTSVDGRIYTFVCYDQWGAQAPDMGISALPEFNSEIDRHRRCGPSSRCYVISTAGPPFGSRVAVTSIREKQLAVARIGQSPGY